MLVGVVTEGVSDFLVVEEVLRQIDPAIPPAVHLWPDTTASGRPFGWRGVRAWCEEFGQRLEVLMRGVEGRVLNGLVIHVDCSMAQNVGARRPCPPARDTAAALRAVVHQQWLRRSAVPWVVVMTPAQTTDAWVVAALSPPFRGLANIECEDAEAELVRRHLARRTASGVKKPTAKYRPLVTAMGRVWHTVRSHCTEAATFEDDLRAASAAIRGSTGPAGSP